MIRRLAAARNAALTGWISVSTITACTGESAELLAARRAAAVKACYGAALAAQAREWAAGAQSGNAQQSARFAAFAKHAEYRHWELAALDSAANHASSDEDSLRFVQLARSFAQAAEASSPRGANFSGDYSRNFAATAAAKGYVCRPG